MVDIRFKDLDEAAVPGDDYWIPTDSETDGVKKIKPSNVVTANDIGAATLTGTETLTNKTLTSPVINSPTGLDKGDVGLGDVDNTSDADKPVSTATQTALDAKADAADLAAVATSGAYSDLSGAPSLATVATSGSYDDLTDQPTIPAAGLPTGGATGQVLAKSSGTDFDAAWTAAGNGDMLASVYAPRIYDFDTVAIATAATITAAQNAIRTGGYAAPGDGGGALYARVGSEPSHNGKFQSADGAWWELSESVPNEAMLGAVGSATSSVRTAAIQSLLDYCAISNKRCQIIGSHTVTSKITIPANANIMGAAPFKGPSQLTLGYNGDMFDVKGNVRIRSLGAQGKGATFSGRAYHVIDGDDQIFEDCFTYDFTEPCLEYDYGVGIRAKVINGFWNRTTSSDPAIVFPDTDTTSTDRCMINVQCGGGTLAYLGAADNVGVSNCNFTNLIFTDNTKKVRLFGNRIANGAVSVVLEVKGIQHSCAGNIVSGDVDLIGSNICWSKSNVMAGTLTNSNLGSPGSPTNTVSTPAKAYTPTWSAATTAPSIGNGSLVGEYEQDEDFCVARVSASFGSSTTFGTGMYTFSLPIAPYAHFRDIIGPAFAFDNGTSFLTGVAILASGSSTVKLIIGTAPTNNVTQNVPITWASGDRIEFEIRYRVTNPGNT